MDNMPEKTEKKTVLITGANGFLGRNLIAALENIAGLELLKYDIGNTFDELSKFAAKSDFVYHLAGVNRPKGPEEYESGNKGFTERLAGLLKETGRKTPVLLSSTIQAVLENPYGLSKKGAEDAMRNYAEETGANVCIYRLPNIFGKWCKPNYNSVVATWCYNLARDLPIHINNPDTEFNLVYVDDVVEEFVNALNGCENRGHDGFCTVSRSFHTSLGDLADRLYSFKDSGTTLVMPDLDPVFQRFLYATYISYLPTEDLGYNLEMKQDHRGWLAEFIKSKSFGQIFISRTRPGITRGNHWHHTKVEKFLVIDGTAVIKLRGVNASDVAAYMVSGDKLKVIDIPAGYTHSITNVGESDVITLFWADEIYDPGKPDTYFSEV